MKHYPLIRTIYLYLFTLVGLVLLVVSLIRFIDMGFKAFIFTKADEEQNIINERLYIACPLEKIEKNQQQEEEICFTGRQKAEIEQMIADYKNWEERNSKINYVVARRHRDASTNLSMILIGLPLYFYHWSIIRRETKNKKEDDNNDSGKTEERA